MEKSALNRIGVIACLLLASLQGLAQSASASLDSAKTEKPVSYMPKIHGTLKTRFEYEPATGESRFQVRNARVDLAGSIAPWVGYRVQADFCDRGKFSVLDAYAQFIPSPHFSIFAGQMRIPFSFNATKPVYQLWFVTKSYIMTQVGSNRDVGIRGRYDALCIPLWIEAGIYNADVMTNHEVWEKELSYAGRVGYKIGNASFQAGAETVYPDSVRISHYSIACHWGAGRWRAEGEYMFTSYTHGAFANAHAYFIAADYGMPIRLGQINRLSFQGRFDGMSDYSNGKRNSQGLLATTMRKRNRLTLGGTLSYIGPAVRCDFRIDGLFMFYPSGTALGIGDHSRLVAEVVVRF